MAQVPVPLGVIPRHAVRGSPPSVTNWEVPVYTLPLPSRTMSPITDQCMPAITRLGVLCRKGAGQQQRKG